MSKTRLNELDDIPADRISFIISQYVHSDRDRYALTMRWIDGKTYSTIAEELSMSDRGVQYLIERYRKKLLKYFV